jgi:hypothetical protein
METVTIKYNASVFTQAGFRGVTMTALVEKISEKRVKVLEVLKIDGEEVKANMSRTGANRQRYYGVAVAAKEKGKTKNLSACELLN